MQKLKDEKRSAIIESASRMFSQEQFHEVRLDDVAAAAKISKGTVYLYFKNKDDLFDTVAFEGVSQIVDQLRDHLNNLDASSWEVLGNLVHELVHWAYENRHIFLLMNKATDIARPRISGKRRELGEIFEEVLKRGIRKKEIVDTSPALTAQMIPACVRSAIMYGPKEMTAKKVTAHIMKLLKNGIQKEPA